MFGYLICNNAEVNETEKKDYQDCYCGLCNRLYFNYGNIGRNTLSYDLTFVCLLLTSVYKPQITTGTERCPVHPIRKHDYWYSEITDYAADMNILLSYYKFIDDYNDDNSKGAKRLADKLSPAFENIKKKYPVKTKRIDSLLGQISEMEKHNVLNPDPPANLFGHIMEEILSYKEDEYDKDIRLMGYHLGRFIYMMDAYMDFKEDIKKERYNPLVMMDLKQIPDIMENIIAQCCLYYEKLPASNYKSITDNILYSGVWTRYNSRKD